MKKITPGSVKRWTSSVGLAVSILVTLGVYLTATHTEQQLRPPRMAGHAELVEKQAEEEAHSGDLGTLQKGVRPDQVTRFVELGTLPDSPGFSANRLQVKKGDVVSLTFRNDSRPELKYVHSFVLLGPGEVFARTPFLKPGQSTTIIFRAPDPGSYTYICTSPGHSGQMRGTLRVVED